MRTVFADTLYWLATTNPRDPWRVPVSRLRSDLGPLQLVTTDEVLCETLTALAGHGRSLRETASRMVRAILSNPRVEVLPQTHDTFLKALARYEQRPDKGYSLTDCATMNAMDALGVREILTNDRHFEQEGYTILVKS